MERIWLKSYEPGVPHSIEYPEISLYEMFQETVKQYSDLPALSFMGHEITYAGLQSQVEELAAALEGLGVKKGDRVAIHLPNCPQFPIAFYAALSLGAIAVPCNPMYVARELTHQLNDSETETIITLTSFYKMIKELQPKTTLKNIIAVNLEEDSVKIETDDYSFASLMKEYGGKQAQPVEVLPEDRAAFMYTGGATGVSKGAILQHRHLLANALQLKAWAPDLKNGEEIFLSVLPLYHSYGLTLALNLPVLTGNKMVLLPRFELRSVLQTIDREKPTRFPGVPTMYVAINNAPDLHEYDLSSIKVCNSGAAPLPVKVQEVFEKITGGKLTEGYGLSEASPVTHSNPIYGKNVPGSIGLPIPDTEMKIVDIETGDTELPIGESGELCVRGPQVMEGYLNMPEETAQSLRDGWLYTGDIAKVDEEGYTYIVDRKKDMVIAGGYNIFPRDIEEVLYTHPKIKEAAVAGISDPYRGETLKAYVVLKEGETLTEEEVIEFCKENLAAYKVPKLVEFRTELPKTMVGKILRRALREEEEKKTKER
ncbi:MAG TPA: long-chain fatty acid--CoA ligase [Bacillota bacterium]|nr:long-chain fatty acid--CoA ligase [Bacillota bacterium]HQD53105.1 long-chain fatty acid--CoA ligase [Bacillota bacterium]